MTTQPPVFPPSLPDAIHSNEPDHIRALRAQLAPLLPSTTRINAQAQHWIEQLRVQGPRPLGLESLLLEYRLDSAEGIALMCLAEALLRIPDPAAADQLIRDLLSPVPWEQHRGHSPDFFVNAASWGLMLSNRLFAADEHPQQWLKRIALRLGEKALRQVLRTAVDFLANQFVLGETLPEALQHAKIYWRHGDSHSFDMLGEAALSYADSQRYFQAYRTALEILASHTAAVHDQQPAQTHTLHPGISIKLSALHPRYSASHWSSVQKELLPELVALCQFAAANRINVAIDAEESDRLEMSLQLFAELLAALQPDQRPHIGIVVQAYQRRALSVLHYLHDLTRHFKFRLNVRLVKGAYWDSEIKRAQQRGLDSYPVFTDKNATDLNYLACAQFLLENADAFYPQFATHNAVTIAALIDMATASQHWDFELQRLHGMGAALHSCVQKQYPQLRCRIYAPVGEHRELLPYLVRRLLENGANTSFIHQLYDHNIPATELAQHPLLRTEPFTLPLPLPRDLFQPERLNSPGVDFFSASERTPLFAAIAVHRTQIESTTTPTNQILDSRILDANAVPVNNPANGKRIGQWQPCTQTELELAIANAHSAQTAWQQIGVERRAACIEAFAESLLEYRAELIALIALETGKTLVNASDEIREAVDFCRYYAAQARQLLREPQSLPGPVGEQNVLWLRPRGVFACISPWNFPLAIFIGQIAAALVTGNTVVAKPAEQSTLVAQRATAIFHAVLLDAVLLDAGISSQVLQLVPGSGETIGAALCAHHGIDGIVFTGGFATAKAIQRQLANRDGAIIPFIAETAGLNCLIADSSAQPQQLVQDVMRSAFDSAGQRCSALRVLWLPESSADHIEELLIGATQTLQLGDPLDWSTDIGPVIDRDALQHLQQHVEYFRAQGRVLYQSAMPSAEKTDEKTGGYFFPATLIRLRDFTELTQESFGPILHLVRYQESAIDQLTATINAAGFGLTCGIHSRNLHRAQTLAQQLKVGNCYINRDLIGAVVGSQPFGGCGKSGTGPKAGGPHYLQRFLTEQTISTNTAALGGDAQLLARAAKRNT